MGGSSSGPHQDCQAQALLCYAQSCKDPGWEELVGARTKLGGSEPSGICPGARCEVLESNFFTFSFQARVGESILGADNFSLLSWQMFIIGFSHILPGQETIFVIIKS